MRSPSGSNWRLHGRLAITLETWRRRPFELVVTPAGRDPSAPASPAPAAQVTGAIRAPLLDEPRSDNALCLSRQPAEVLDQGRCGIPAQPSGVRRVEGLPAIQSGQIDPS